MIEKVMVKEIAEAVGSKSTEIPNIEQIKNTSLESLEAQVKAKESAPMETRELTEVQKQTIKDLSGWSDEIVDAIGSMEEFNVYRNAGLVEAEIGGKKCLINPDIDMQQKDEFGRTNYERIKANLSPIAKDGQIVELHHIGQHKDSPLAELTTSDHRQGGNNLILHSKWSDSETHGAGNTWLSERNNHWKDRLEQ